MFLEVEGFINVRAVSDPGEYSGTISGAWRNFTAACFTAEVESGHDPAGAVADWIEDYEGGLVRTLLPAPLIDFLYHRIHGDKSRPRSLLDVLASRMIAAKAGRASFWLRLLRRAMPDRHGYEILKNLRFGPADKIRVERGKALLARGETAQAEAALKAVTSRLNADWRSVYRSFCLLAWTCRQRGDAKGAARYEELCRLANPQFPATVLTDSVVSFRSLSA
jgi:hypothetical protein